MLRWIALCLALCACTPAAPRCLATTVAPPTDLLRGAANIQRTMRLLETSTPAHPNRVRILFYGQSITQSAWSRHVERWLLARYPSAQLEIQNRALGGFASQRLVETAETDLYPFQPDLIIFHVYGAHDSYEDIVRRVRARTTAELLVQTDHVTRPRDLDEPREACASPPDAEHWDAFMNQAFLPSLVERYQVALCDVRSAWKEHLRVEHVPPSALLADEVHPNALGDRLLASLVERCLRAEPQSSPAEDWVERIDLLPRDQAGIRLPFVGTRIDLIVAPSAALTARIDGAPASTVVGFERAHTDGAGKWPPVHGVTHHTPLLRETFTITMHRRDQVYAFSVVGSQTGADGEGQTDLPFVSRSGRVVVEPTQWDLAYTFALAGTPLPDRLAITLPAAPRGVDFVRGAEGTESTVTVASGLADGGHLLELAGDPRQVRAALIFRPPARE